MHTNQFSEVAILGKEVERMYLQIITAFCAWVTEMASVTVRRRGALAARCGFWLRTLPTRGLAQGNQRSGLVYRAQHAPKANGGLSHGSRKVLHLREAQPGRSHRRSGTSTAIAAFIVAGTVRAIAGPVEHPSNDGITEPIVG